MRKIIFFMALTLNALTIFVTSAFADTLFVEAKMPDPWLPYVVGPNETVGFSGYVQWPPMYLDVATSEWSLFGEYSSGSVSYDYLVNTLGKAPGYYSGAVCLEAYAMYYDFMAEPPILYSWYGADCADLEILPEPTTLVLLGTGALPLLRRRR